MDHTTKNYPAAAIKAAEKVDKLLSFILTDVVCVVINLSLLLFINIQNGKFLRREFSK